MVAGIFGIEDGDENLIIVLGVLYDRWAGSEEYVPISATLVVVVADSL